MIRITKQRTAPKKLREDGVAETKVLKAAYDVAPSEYGTGSRKFVFKGSVYGHGTVKKMLLRAQFQKCCFCESKITHIAYGDVEHFRPKAGHRQKKGQQLGRPGYYWLAYEWDNLFLSCQICNQRYKESLFPLENQRRRASSHHDTVADEKPVLLHPSRDRVEDFIGFREEYPYPINGRARGRQTIKHLGLKREELAEFRRDFLVHLKAEINSYRLLIRRFPADGRPSDVTRHISKLEKLLRKAIQPEAQYSSMAKAAIGGLLDD